jgi:hypothetical protein
MTLREELAQMWDELAESEVRAANIEFAKGTETGDTLGQMLIGCAHRSGLCAMTMRRVRNLEDR